MFIELRSETLSCSVVFDNSTNPFIQARATATNNGIPGAIFRAASELPNGPQGTFDLPNGFLDLTSQVYVRLSSFVLPLGI